MTATTAAAPRDRITIPVDVDRAPAATLAVAAVVARQGALGVEFVGVAGRRRTDPAARLRDRCEVAGAAGVTQASWALLDGTDTDVGMYATWSGTTVVCIGLGTHSTRTLVGEPCPPELRSCRVPMLVVGPHACHGVPLIRRVVAGLDGSAAGLHVALAAARLATRLGADLELTEVVDARWLPADVHESAYLHGVAAMLEHRPRSFDTLHDHRAAAGLLRFVGRDRTAVIAVGMPAHRRSRGVAQRVVRCAPSPVLLVPRPQVVTNPS